MSHKKYILSWQLALVLASLGFLLPLHAADSPAPDTTSAPGPLLASDPPSLLNSSSGAGLRPLPPDVAPPSATDAPPAASSGSPGPAASSTPATPSQNVTINLINLMVKRGLITADDAANLIRQAEQEADTARAQAATAQATAERALAAQAAAPAPAPAPTPVPDDTVRVAYVPDVVKKQITDQVTEDVMKQTREENLTAKSDTPDWVKRFRVTGDIRVRYEGDFYPSGNASGTEFTNYNAIDTGAPFNFGSNNPNFPPSYNVDQDRNRLRFRARIGADIDLGQNFTAGMRVATGSDDSPVTENQTLGGANSAQGGNFGKYQIWLDRAFIKYEMGATPDKDLSFTIGRFDNPFFHTSMIWADDLGFDGAVVQARYKVADGVTPFFVAGGFPVFNTDLNFASNQPTKFRSEDKWLYAAQLGANWTINKDFTAKVGAACYYFQNIEGKVSDPFVPLSASDAGSTDDSRPSFAQNGNTYIALRDITPNASNGFGTTNQYQYFGLATPFHEFAFTSQLDFSRFDPFHMWLTGEFVKNLAFDRNAIINNGPPNALGPQNNLLNPKDPTSFVGGDTGWIVKLNMGKVALEQLWDWNVSLSYRYVQSDATVDGFTDSDFGGGLAGTNLKGYTLGGNLALSPRVWTGLRWMSADSIAGPTYKNDLIQFDINAKF
jgi:hypothetical protein